MQRRAVQDDRHLDHYGVPAAQGDGVPVSNFPVYARIDVLAGWGRAKARFLPERTEFMRQQDPILHAVRDLEDDAWIGVSELGKLAGRVVDGDVREQARRFSAELREKNRLGEGAFKRTSAGTAVNVGAIRAAVNFTVAA